MNKKILKIGHRGACGYEPENTMSSFSKAILLGVDILELDVHICKTGEIVVIHDDTLERTANRRGLVADKSLSELEKLDVGQGQKIPALNEVLNLVERKAKINIELKGSNTSGPVCDLIEEYVKHRWWMHSDFLVSSFNYSLLIEFRKLCSSVNVGVLIADNAKRGMDFAKDIKAYSIHPYLGLANHEFVDQVHNNNMKFFAWVANEKNDIAKLKSMGVDGIFSDYPDRL